MSGKAIRLDGTRRVGHILRDLRVEAGLTRGQLAVRVAARTGQKARTVGTLLCKWEAGKVRTPDGYLFDSVMQEFGYGVALVPLTAMVGHHA